VLGVGWEMLALPFLQNQHAVAVVACSLTKIPKTLLFIRILKV
jgi:hypothetical protein